MKILYLSEMLGPHDYRILKTLISRGYEAILVPYRKTLDDARLESAYYDVRNIKGLKIIHKSALGENTPANFLKRIADFRAILKSEKPDIVHSGWILTSGFLAALSGFGAHLLMPYGSDISYFAYSSLRNRCITRYTIRKAHMVACNCEEHKKLVVRDFKCSAEKVIVVPLAADLTFFNKGNADADLKARLGLEGKKIILMMRIFRSEYGIEDFIRALPMVRELNPDSKVLMLGYGPLEQSLKQLSLQLGLNDYIHWTGYVPQHEVVKYINAADVYVSTSYRDGSSASLLESMACGLPVVVSDIPSNLEWVANGVNGIVVKRSDPASIAGGINRVLTDEVLRYRMSDNNIKMAQRKADFSKNFSLFEDAYMSISAMGKNSLRG